MQEGDPHIKPFLVPEPPKATLRGTKATEHRASRQAAASQPPSTNLYLPQDRPYGEQGDTDPVPRSHTPLRDTQGECF